MNFEWRTPGERGQEDLYLDGKLVGSIMVFGHGASIYDDEGSDGFNHNYVTIAEKISDAGTAKILLMQYFMEKCSCGSSG